MLVSDHMRKEVMEITGVGETKGWNVCDVIIYEDEPVLAKFNVIDETSPFYFLHGAIIDLKKRIVYATSGGQIPPSVAVNLTEVNDKIEFTNLLPKSNEDSEPEEIGGETISLTKSSLKIKPYFDGVVMQVFKYDGIIYTSSQRQFNPEKSKWGDSPYFLDLYRELNGPTSELFDKEKRFSPHTHVFVMVHHAFFVSSKLRIKKPFLVYLGSLQSWSTSNCPYFDEEVDWELHRPTNLSTTIGEGIYTPPVFDVEECNKFLRTGWDSLTEEEINETDNRLLPGETVVIYEHNEDGSVKQTLKVFSPASHWRFKLRGDNANVKLAIYQNFDYLRTRPAKKGQTDDSRNIQNYSRMFPTLAARSPKEISDLIMEEKLIYWPTSDRKLQGKSLVENLFNVYLMAVPHHLQESVNLIYDEYTCDNQRLTDWICSFKSQTSEEITSKFLHPDSRVVDRIVALNSYAAYKSKNPNSHKITIRKALQIENGVNLYRLTRTMNSAQN